MEPLNPTPSLLCKLGSLVIHVERVLSDDDHAFDHVAVQSLIEDDEVQQWLKEMNQLSLIIRNECNGAG